MKPRTPEDRMRRFPMDFLARALWDLSDHVDRCSEINEWSSNVQDIVEEAEGRLWCPSDPGETCREGCKVCCEDSEEDGDG